MTALPARIAAFISIPKNASKSVLEILELGGNRDRDHTYSPVIYENHQRGIILAQRYDLRPLLVFCFCRDPYDRTVSWFEFHKHLSPYRETTFAEWVKGGMPHHFTRQNLTDYVKEGISPLLQYSFIENIQTDFIGRIERFETDMKTIVGMLNARAEQTGIQRRFAFRPVHSNISARRMDTDSYYDQETRLVVNRLLKRDFEYFGYLTRDQ